MSGIINYAIVRFRPFAETGEFANVGILAFAGSDLHFKLAPARFKRVSQFFTDLDPRTFSRSLDHLRQELEYFCSHRESDLGAAITQFVSTPKESVWNFSEVRRVRGGAKIGEVVDELYDRYVGRNFVTPEYREQVLVRAVKKTLNQHHIVSFKPYSIDDELVPITFPLVSPLKGLSVIRPLAFQHRTTLGMIDHAAAWHDRFKLLFERNRLMPGNVLLPLEGPSVQSDPAFDEAFARVKLELASLGTRIIDSDDQSALLDFAKPRGVSLSQLH